MDIIGRDSVALKGIGVPEASGSNAASVAVSEVEVENSGGETEKGQQNGSTEININPSREERRINKRKLPSSNDREYLNEEKKLRLEKLRLQNEALKLDIIKKKIELYEKKEALGIKFSNTVTHFLEEIFDN